MDGRAETKKDSKESNVIPRYKGQETVENSDLPSVEDTRCVQEGD